MHAQRIPPAPTARLELQSFEISWRFAARMRNPITIVKQRSRHRKSLLVHHSLSFRPELCRANKLNPAKPELTRLLDYEIHVRLLAPRGQKSEDGAAWKHDLE